MPRSVFISCVHGTSHPHALALQAELGTDVACLAGTGAGAGDPFPQQLGDALLDSRVVVIFAEPAYFTDRQCLLEYRLALTPYLRSADRADATRDGALRGIVVALPQGEADPMLDHIPPSLREDARGVVDGAATLAAVVRARLAEPLPTLRERYGALGGLDAVHALVRETAVLPSPHRIGGIPLVPLLGLPQSIHERFVGRADEIWRIHHVLTTPGGRPGAAALAGSLEAGGGVGKTRLALEYVHRFGTRHFRGGLFWIDAEQELEDQLFAVIQALNPAAPDLAALRGGQDGVAGALVRLVRGRPDDAPPLLFVIDNVPEPPPGRPPLPLAHWCPVLGEAAVLATSRTRLSLAGGNVAAIPVHPLDRDAAVRLLVAGGGHGALSFTEAGEVAEWVGNLPLALELLNGVLVSGAMPAAELLRASRERRPAAELDAAMEVLRGAVAPGSLRGVTEAFAASYERLTEREQLGARLMAWMAPATVPEGVVEAFGRLPPQAARRGWRWKALRALAKGTRAVLRRSGVVSPWSFEFTQAVRATLRTRHFVTAPAPGTGEGDGAMFGGMHGLLADFVRSRAARARTERSLLADTLWWAGEEGTVDDQIRTVRLAAPVIAAFLRNALTADEDVEEAFVYTSAFAARMVEAGAYAPAEQSLERLVPVLLRLRGEEHPQTLTARENLALALRLRGQFARAREVQEQVLSVRRRIHGDEHPGTLDSMYHLAVVHWARGDHSQAQRLLEEVLAARRRTLGEEHSDTLTAMGSLGVVMWERGDLAGAQRVQEEALSLMTRISGAEHPETLKLMNNHALTLQARGDYVRAQEVQERVLALGRRLNGEEHADTLMAMSNLGATLRARGDLAGAHELQERTLATAARIFGDEHPATLLFVNNLAEVRLARGDLDGAQELAQLALATMPRVLGEEHPLVLKANGNLAFVLVARGDYAGAEMLQERVLDVSRRTLGDDHPDTLKAMGNHAEMIRARGDLSGARALQEHLVDASRRILGEEHPDTLRAMNNLAGTLDACGDKPAAQAILEQVMEASMRVLGEDHPHTLYAMNNFAFVLWDRGDAAGAQALEERALAARIRLQGESHPDTLMAMQNLADTLRGRGDLAGAQALGERVLAARTRVLGEEHPDTLHTADTLALTRFDRGDTAGARDLQEQALTAYARVRGHEHPDTLGALYSLAMTLSALGDHARAQDLNEQLVAARRHILGEENPSTLRAMNNLAVNHWNRGDPAGARDLHEQVLEIRRRVLGEEDEETLLSMANLAHTLEALGHPAHARALREQVLSVTRRVRGEHHSATTRAAWNLLRMLVQGEEWPRAREVLGDLRWLSDADPAALSEDQKGIRDRLPEMIWQVEETGA